MAGIVGYGAYVPRNRIRAEEIARQWGKDPDAIVAECLRTVEEGARIRLKARRRYMASIEEFEKGHPLGRTAGNVVRSFLIHNGIAMSANVMGA